MLARSGLKTHLITLSILDSNGYRYHAMLGVLKVWKGSMTIMMERLIGRQYVLLGSAIIGEVITVESESRDHDLTYL